MSEEKLVALPEAHLPEPPHPLVAGAFLGGEYEVKELVARGLTNFYLAFGGDYSSPLPKLIAERETEDRAAAQEQESFVVPELQSELFPAAQRHNAQDREYLMFDWSDTVALQDWREVANDTRYLQAVRALTAGMRELENTNLTADFTRETLRFDAEGALKYFGFFDDASQNQATPSLLDSLKTLNAFLLRQVFGEAGTIRLDDQWSALAMSEEVKEFSRRLEQEYSSLEEVAEAIIKLAPQSSLRADSALQTDVGQERDVNEDSALIARFARAGERKVFDIELYALSDGMGGHEGGEVASDLALNVLQQIIASDGEIDWQDNVQVRTALRAAIEQVNAKVLALTEEPQYRASRAKPGATLLFMLRVDERLFFGNVGDSRAYQWNASTGLQRITKDHSYVQTLIDSGEISEEEAFVHPDSSIITAHIGMRKLRQMDLFVHLASPGDTILLVSDGVTDMLREGEIEAMFQEKDPRVLCQNLVDAANDAGGHDNITAVCLTLE